MTNRATLVGGYLIMGAILLIAGVTGTVVAQQGGDSVDALGSPDLNVFAPDNELTPGEKTTLTVQVSNDGNYFRGGPGSREIVTTARSATIRLDDSNTPVNVISERRAIGDVSVSEPKSVDFTLVVPDDAKIKKYDLTAKISYKYIRKATTVGSEIASTSISSNSASESVRIKISNDARFSVTEVDSELYVGEEGEITGRIRNIGGTRAHNAEIRFTPSNENINALSSTVAVGDIPTGDSVPFSLPVEVTSNGEAVPHRFDLNVNYRDDDGISQSTDEPEFLADISPSRDAFLVEPVNSTIPAGESRTMDLRVTNNLNQTVTDIEGKFFADDPLDSSNDETFTGSLDPGETTTVTVDLSSSGGATIKNYPASVDFRYVDNEGDSKLTDSYRVAISVTEPSDDGGGLPVGPLVIGLVVIGSVGGVLWRRTGGDLGGLRDR